MRKLIAIFAAFLLILGYAAWPAWSAWRLRNAVKARDIPSIESRVDWPTLRTNLKRTVASGLGDESKDTEAGTFTKALKRTLPKIINPMIDVAVTPNNLSHVLAGRVLLKELAGRMPGRSTPAEEAEREAEVDPLAPRRLRYAFFESPTRFRVEVADRREPGRRIVSVFELQGFVWRLIDVYYKTPAAA
jgi:hypothetical protein